VILMAEKEERAEAEEPEEHIKALAKIWKRKPKPKEEKGAGVYEVHS